MTQKPHSAFLTRRLLTVLVLSLSAVALLLGVGGAWLIERVAEQSADRVLSASARAIAETLAVENGEITLDLPASALGMLENNERDNVYYSVRQGDELLTGYADLPTASLSGVNTDATQFRYETYRGRRVRVATEIRRLPLIVNQVVVQVAETLEARRAIANRLLIGLVLLECLLVMVAAILVWPAVRWSLRPVTRLRREIENRDTQSANFTRLNEQDVPMELRGLVHAFNTLLGSLEQAVDRMRHFTADASHQMRTPLTILRTHLAVLRRYGTDTVEGRESLTDVENAADRLQRLLVQLVALARADETRTSTIRLSSVDLRERAIDVINRARPDAENAGVNIELQAEPRPYWANCEPVLVAELLFNLLDNAVRYNKTDGSVIVRIHEQAAHTTVTVEDNGPGVPSEDRERIFERFHRLSRDQHHHGSGLGLPIVRALAQSLHAQVNLSDNIQGSGLKVEVRFKTALAASES